MGPGDLAIVIPAFNEEYTIGSVVSNIVGNHSVIVVDDGSNDKTHEIARCAGAEVFTINNIGYEKALMYGLRKAEKKGFKFALTIDGDNQFPLSEIDKLIQLASDDVSVVIGCREKLQRRSEDICSIVYDFLFRVRDPISGMKLYNLSRTSFIKLENPLLDTYGLYAITKILKSKSSKVKCTNIKTTLRIDESRVGSNVLVDIKIVIGMLYSLIFASK